MVSARTIFEADNFRGQIFELKNELKSQLNCVFADTLFGVPTKYVHIRIPGDQVPLCLLSAAELELLPLCLLSALCSASSPGCCARCCCCSGGWWLCWWWCQWCQGGVLWLLGTTSCHICLPAACCLLLLPAFQYGYQYRDTGYQDTDTEYALLNGRSQLFSKSSVFLLHCSPHRRRYAILAHTGAAGALGPCQRRSAPTLPADWPRGQQAVEQRGPDLVCTDVSEERRARRRGAPLDRCGGA